MNILPFIYAPYYYDIYMLFFFCVKHKRHFEEVPRFKKTINPIYFNFKKLFEKKGYVMQFNDL